MSRARAWCFTINNWTEAEKALCDTIECNYIVYGHEVGEEGTPHLQGYIELKDAKSRNAIKKLLGDRGHFEARKGTPKGASDYCKKSDPNFVERGMMGQQGKRTDLQEIADLVINGGMINVMQHRPDAIIKYPKGLEKLVELTMTERKTKPKVVWVWGDAGVGKTRLAVEGAESHYVWSGTKWWNGYSQQQRIIMDDFTHDTTDENRFRYLLRILDRYTCQVETKGGMIHLNSPEIYITCDKHPETVFSDPGKMDNQNRLRQMLRRIDEIIHLEPKVVEYEDDFE
ncbi:Rep [uncultured virus]|uniref:ATP-dependent helicase Rep n=1 Tax=uncultured virus TaxID=340016 RepID=A0A2K9LT34_9VIRU|nr:Rep [uncultured virus]